MPTFNITGRTITKDGDPFAFIEPYFAESDAAKEEFNAFARLAAAAPTMLSVLENALDYLADECEPHWSPEQASVVSDLRAAIAKAKSHPRPVV